VTDLEEHKPAAGPFARLLGDRVALGFSSVYLGVAALIPPGGAPKWADICILHRITGLPCPGCGMTRSLGHLLRGDVAHSLTYHPMGIVLAPALLLAVVLWIGPERWRTWAVARARPHEKLLAVLIVGGFALFMLYGLVRLFLVYRGEATFPA